MNATPFQLLKRSHAEALAARAHAALAQWSQDWAALPDCAVSCTAASDAPAIATGAVEQRRLLDSGAAVWVAMPAGMERTLEQMLFGLQGMDGTSDKHLASQLGTSLAEEALEALLHALCEGLTGQASRRATDAGPAAALMRPGSGAVACKVQIGERSMRLLLPADVLGAPQPLQPRHDAPPLASLLQALAPLEVPLSIEICRTELTLGYLRTLAVGDVLALPMGIDQELRVAGPGDTTVCHAHLGAMDGAYAVELIKAPR